MENLWGILARQIYVNGQQYETINQLKDAIIKKWEEIPLNVLQNLIKSMPERIYQVITKKVVLLTGKLNIFMFIEKYQLWLYVYGTVFNHFNWNIIS